MNSNVGDLQVFCCQLETSLSRYGFLLLLVLSCKAGLAPCKKALFFNTGSMERWGSFDLQVFTFQVQLSPFPCTVLHGWAGAVQEGFILLHRKHGTTGFFWSPGVHFPGTAFSFSLYCLTLLGWRRARRLHSSTQEAWEGSMGSVDRILKCLRYLYD